MEKIILCDYKKFMSDEHLKIFFSDDFLYFYEKSLMDNEKIVYVTSFAGYTLTFSTFNYLMFMTNFGSIIFTGKRRDSNQWAQFQGEYYLFNNGQFTNLDKNNSMYLLRKGTTIIPHDIYIKIIDEFIVSTMQGLNNWYDMHNNFDSRLAYIKIIVDMVNILERESHRIVNISQNQLDTYLINNNEMKNALDLMNQNMLEKHKDFERKETEIIEKTIVLDQKKLDLEKEIYKFNREKELFSKNNLEFTNEHDVKILKYIENIVELKRNTLLQNEIALNNENKFNELRLKEELKIIDNNVNTKLEKIHEENKKIIETTTAIKNEKIEIENQKEDIDKKKVEQYELSILLQKKAISLNLQEKKLMKDSEKIKNYVQSVLDIDVKDIIGIDDNK